MSNKRRDAYCQELAELIAACDANDPDPEHLARIESHIDQCPVCQSAESALNETVDAFRSSEPAGVSRSFEEQLVERLCRDASNGGTRSPE